MNIDILMACFTLGLGVGLISSFLGIGGGMLIVPLLPMIVLLPIRDIVGTSLLTVFAVVVLNSISFHRQQLVEWRVAIWVGASASVAAFFAARATSLVSPVVIKWVLFAILVILAIRVILFGNGQKPMGGEVQFPKVLSTKMKAAFLSLGTLAGLTSGFVGVGTGLIMSPVLYTFRVVSAIKVSPTSNACLVFATGFGTLSYLSESVASRGSLLNGFVHFDLAIAIFLGSILTSWIGRKKQAKLSDRTRRVLLAALLVVLAVKTAYMTAF